MADEMQAVVQRNKDSEPILSKEAIPKPRFEDHQALVKLSHVAQNPTDVQTFDRNAFGDGEIKGVGAYAEYTVADERISFKIPPGISPAAASTVPLAAATAWLAMFSKDSLNISRNSSTTILVWGGSSSVGLYTIQLACTQNFTVITTCSPRNFDLVKSVGAQHVFDYSDADVVNRIKQVAPDLQYVFDTIGNESSSAIASKAIRQQGGGLCTVRPGKANTEECTAQTKVTDVLVWTAFLKDHAYGELKWPANEDDHEIAAELFENLPEWLEKGVVKPNAQSVKKGLEKVKDGFQEHRDGKISAYKIVYEV
ncbi:Zinc-binding oxidoreductase alcohol dehydrogenase [Paraconiothyrium brasiliense]|uniref:Zinc-binding oxidoreductase alcohol dehydrogenase n=1 Tax=Paraconiothyrium brasiliense TaxID=300254 RepID=A0ABR3RL35_9PLEO